ncbi:GtrA family protein [Parafrigoribacterium soli]|uniref:GtrA family protein n=1 Tax=Parafrigoribacterium soli TaxID=3144663 RepID=UPI0032EC7C04
MSRESRSAFLRELISFGLVGGVGLVVDIVVFNALRTTVLSPTVMHGGPILAKVISTSLAITCNWVGNRLWTYRDRRRSDVVREGIEFAVVSGAGMAIAVGCLWISHYLLGYTSLLADNVATNVVGLALGTAFRFALYRWWVFGASRTKGMARPVATQPLTTGSLVLDKDTVSGN